MLRLTQVYFVHCTISSYGKEWEYISESKRERESGETEITKGDPKRVCDCP